MVKFYKSMVHFSKEIQVRKKQDIVDILQGPSSNRIRNYLGCKNIDNKIEILKK